MSDIVISAENVGKKYRLGVIGSGMLREDVARLWARLRRRPDPYLKVDQQNDVNVSGGIIWALHDASFEIKQGEVVGIIGRNGAGKSTLLKILSRITAPTHGQVRLRGRIASLLEVGTGFHPELTGRENIYLNGSILGMRRREIDRKLEEIVDFSGVAQFLDTPVKRYSSGMYVRLAFSVAAHLEPEILLVDEVLAVGDLQFQKKCLGKMDEVAHQGRTVLFVSHNMQAIRTLCLRSILLERGSIVSDASTEVTLHEYNRRLRDVKVDHTTSVGSTANRRGSGAARFTSIMVQDEGGKEQYNFSMGQTVRFKLSYAVYQDIAELWVNVALRSGVTGEIITSIGRCVSSAGCSAGDGGTVVIELPDVFIRPGDYPLYFWLGDSLGQPFDVVDDLTLPLMITVAEHNSVVDFAPSAPIGYFSVPARFACWQTGPLAVDAGASLNAQISRS